MKTQSFFIRKECKIGAPIIEIQIPTQCPTCNIEIIVSKSDPKFQSYFDNINFNNNCCGKIYREYHTIWDYWIQSGGSVKNTNNVYPNGLICKKCHEHYPYAEPNQNDGTLICFGCGRGRR